MTYSYSFLKEKAFNGESIGSWNGKRVYAASKKDVGRLYEKYFYVLYDDKNMIYNDGYIYGYLSLDGTVTEIKKMKYETKEKNDEVKVQAEIKVAMEEFKEIHMELDKMMEEACNCDF